uniref:Uncharacterized protein n=1 Tax=Strongyloides stercoralis TaxID=6248 RepID=A0A0K0EAP2_STRER
MVDIVRNFPASSSLSNKKECFENNFQLKSSNFSFPFKENLSISSSLESIVEGKIDNEDNDVYYDAVEFLENPPQLVLKTNENFRRRVSSEASDLYTDIEDNNKYSLKLHPDISRRIHKKVKPFYLNKSFNNNLLQPQNIDNKAIVKLFDEYMEEKSHIILSLLFHPAFLTKTESNNITSNYNERTMYSVRPTEANLNIKMKLKSY